MSEEIIINWNRTVGMCERLEGKLSNGKYEGRHIISRDTPINRGVYLGASQREAIVVDYDKDEELQKLYNDLLTRISNKKVWIQQEVYNLVLERIPYDLVKMEGVVNRFNVNNDGKIRLGRFIENRAGTCRQQALAVGFLLERLKEHNLIRGKPSIDRNDIKSNHLHGGHVWVRYFSGHEAVYIIDVAQQFLGRLEDSVNLKWDYFRPGERLKYKK